MSRHATRKSEILLKTLLIEAFLFSQFKIVSHATISNLSLQRANRPVQTKPTKQPLKPTHQTRQPIRQLAQQASLARSRTPASENTTDKHVHTRAFNRPALAALVGSTGGQLM